MRLSDSVESEVAKRVLGGALAWLDGHVDYFDPFKTGELSGYCEIPSAELAILTLSLLQDPSLVDGGVLRNFLDLLEHAYENPIYRERPFREPESLVSHLVVTAALERSGRLDHMLDRGGLERLLATSTLTAPALPPHRMMELRHALDLVDVNHGLPSYDALYRATMAARNVNPIFVSRSEAYIVTHVIFYAADLGRRAPLGIYDEERYRLGRLVDRMLGMNVIARNWDLTAEFILSACCLQSPSSFMGQAWTCLESAQRINGAVPGTRARDIPDAEDRLLTDSDHDVAASYHTTLVSALAALSFLNSPMLASG